MDATCTVGLELQFSQATRKKMLGGSRAAVTQPCCAWAITEGLGLGCSSPTSVTASMEAPVFRSNSITRTWFFLQAMWRGVKPFYRQNDHQSIASTSPVPLPFSSSTPIYPFLAHPSWLTRALELGLAPFSTSSLATRWWPQCAATCSGVRWSRVMSSISALYCRSRRTQSR